MILTFAFFSFMVVQPTPKPAPKSVVVELFTSEGCSSCPPADELLEKLKSDLSLSGAKIIALGFHVDYWDYLGWRDNYDSAAFTHRQRDYAAALHLPNVYTPQMIVDGTRPFIGSSNSEARHAITEATQAPKWDVLLSLDQDVLHIHLPSPGLNTEVLLALTEDGLESRVLRGENGGHTLHHAAVVRELRRLDTTGIPSGGVFDVSIPIHLKPEWKREKMHAVVFVQESKSRKIIGAAEVGF